MKIVTWNVAGGDKRSALSGVETDLLLLQERRKADCCDGEEWVGSLEAKGISARSGGGFSIRRAVDDLDLPRYFVPYQVSGGESFQLIDVWAINEGEDRYVRGTVRAVDLWAERIAAQPTVIAGDFNANRIWDPEHPSDRNFSALVRRLEELGLVSAYHAFFGEEFGAETRPTFFLYRHAAKAYHLDYCFIPRAWLPRLRAVEVGTHDAWSRFSDHMPVTVVLE